jgi:hypothetical protein
MLVTLIIKTVVWLYLHRNPCKERNCTSVFNDSGFGYVDKFLHRHEFNSIKRRYVKDAYPMYPDNTFLLGNERKKTIGHDDSKIVALIKEKVEKIVGVPLYVDYAFLRYYNGKAPNPFEFFHLDSKHYDHDTTQIRCVVNLYDETEQGVFSYKCMCCNQGKIFSIKTKVNTLTLIQANKLIHKYEYKGGERLIYVIDFTTSYKRGLYGSVWGLWDFFWDRIQKKLTSFHNHVRKRDQKKPKIK